MGLPELLRLEQVFGDPSSDGNVVQSRQVTLEEIQLLICDPLPAITLGHVDLNDMPAGERGGEPQVSGIADLITFARNRDDQLFAACGFFIHTTRIPP
ncbi:hypothetical protein D3C87_1874830 [compost metagenome]